MRASLGANLRWVMAIIRVTIKARNGVVRTITASPANAAHPSSMHKRVID